MSTNDPEGSWEHFHHQADIGIRGIGASKEEAFVQAARALTGVIADPSSIRSLEIIRIHCEAPDDEILLVDWLNALVYEMGVRKMIFGEYKVRINGHSLDAEIGGEVIDIARHQPIVEVKGATYTSLEVRQDDSSGMWIAQCVVDV